MWLVIVLTPGTCDSSLIVLMIVSALRPPMNNIRRHIVRKVFEKFDTTGDGVITVADIIKTYDVTKHPKFQVRDNTNNLLYKDIICKVCFLF